MFGSNNTNKLSPQELHTRNSHSHNSSNNTNKLSPQELKTLLYNVDGVQIIQINLVLKNLTLITPQWYKSSNNTNKLSPQELSTLL